MTKEEADQALESKSYRFAKTMPQTPHCYSVRKEWEDEEQFESVVQFMRENGVTEYFGNRPYKYYYLNGYKYWTMGNPIQTTTIINRAKNV